MFKALSIISKGGIRTNYLRPTTRFFSTESFLNGANANCVDSMHEQWQKDPTSVHASWQAYFAGSSFELPPTLGKNAQQG